MANTAFKAPPLSQEEEDELIHARLSNDEKLLKRVIKRYHAFAAIQRSISSNPQMASTPVTITSLEGEKRTITKAEQLSEARDAFLLDLSLFQLNIQKSVLVCEAEKRQVLEYEKEKQRIENEGVNLRQDIERLKVQLEYEQRRRKQKIEYDLKADKINQLPSRADSEQNIAIIKEEIAIARNERDTLHSEMLERRGEFDAIVHSILLLRTRGLTKEEDAMEAGQPTANTTAPGDGGSGSRPGSPASAEDGHQQAPAGPAETAPPGSASAMLNPLARSFLPGTSGLRGTPAPSNPGTPHLVASKLPPATASALLLQSAASSRGPSTPLPPAPSTLPSTTEDENGNDDIEMGEVAEDDPPKVPSSPKKRISKEELEEGEDSGSELTDLPEDFE